MLFPEVQHCWARHAYLKGGSPDCDAKDVTGEFLSRAGMKVIRNEGDSDSVMPCSASRFPDCR